MCAYLELQRDKVNCRCISDSPLAYRWKIPPAKNRALHYTEVGRSLHGCESLKMEHASPTFWRLEFEDGSETLKKKNCG